MNKLIELDSNNALVIQPEALAIDAYAKIWTRDKSKTKSQAIKELTFIYYVASLDKINPYKEYVGEERIEAIKADLMDKDWKMDKIIVTAIEQYKKHNYTATTGILASALKAADKVKQFFDQVDLNEKDEYGKLVNKASDLIKNLKDIGGVIEGIKKLMELELQERETEGGKIRGGGRVGLFENNRLDNKIEI